MVAERLTGEELGVVMTHVSYYLLEFKLGLNYRPALGVCDSANIMLLRDLGRLRAINEFECFSIRRHD